MGFYSECYKRCILKTRYIIVTTCLLFYSQVVFADQTTFGPRFEIGIGGSGSRLQSKPEWSSKLYTSAILTYACRILYGLSIHGGKNLGLGNKLDERWIEYGNHYQINTDKGTYRDVSWWGARYEIPMSIFNKDIYRIHSVYCSGGLTLDRYDIRSQHQRYYKTDYGWESGEIPEEQSSESSFNTADLKGYYFALAARWRFDTPHTEEEDSWIGSYGLDFGIRYTKYYDCNTKYDNLIEAKSNFNYYQIFIVGFIKIKFLY